METLAMVDPIQTNERITFYKWPGWGDEDRQYTLH